MKKLLVMALVLVGTTQISAQSACRSGQSWQCLSAQPPALGVFCGCASDAVSSIHIIASKSSEPWNSCLACD